MLEKEIPLAQDRGLYARIVERAIRDLRLGKWREDAIDWIFGHPGGAIVSFEECCEILDINPKICREKIIEQYLDWCFVQDWS